MATTNRPATAPRRYHLSFALLAAFLTLSAAAFYAISAISGQNSVMDRRDVVHVSSGLSREEEKESGEERKQQRAPSPPSPQPKSETFHSVSSSDARETAATEANNRRPVRREPCGGRFLADKRGALPELTILVQNPRTGSLFLSGRLAKYGTGRFRYVVQRLKDLSPRPFRSPDDFAQWACVDHPGHKVIVWDSGGTPNWVLQHWPRGTVLVMTGDEAGRWGLYDRKRHWGPFGDDDDTEEALFDANMSHPLHPIVLPPDVTPWFRQYADPKQAQAFDASLAIYWPLGSRFEFPDLDPAAAKPSSTRSVVGTLDDGGWGRQHPGFYELQSSRPITSHIQTAICTFHPPLNRKYTASLMASTTDPSRKLLATVLNDTATFPREKVSHWTKGTSVPCKATFSARLSAFTP